MEFNKPDLMIHDLKLKEITLVEVGITKKRILSTIEVTKSLKYELLAGELHLMFPVRTVQSNLCLHLVSHPETYMRKYFYRCTARNPIGKQLDDDDIDRLFDLVE